MAGGRHSGEMMLERMWNEIRRGGEWIPRERAPRQEEQVQRP